MPAKRATRHRKGGQARKKEPGAVIKGVRSVQSQARAPHQVTWLKPGGTPSSPSKLSTSHWMPKIMSWPRDCAQPCSGTVARRRRASAR